MVNNENCRLLVSGACVTVVNAKGRTIISNGPVYKLTKAQAFLNFHGLRVINEKAQTDQTCDFSPELNDDELKKFICALNANDYQKSERCATSIGKTIDCDAYAMTWNRTKDLLINNSNK